MSTTNINVRVDTELKKSAEALFADLGINMPSAITMFLKSAVSHDGIPFDVKHHTPKVAFAAVFFIFANFYINSIDSQVEALNKY